MNMAHSKCYAICENKCKVETLSKETLDYRYSQTDKRILTLSSDTSVIYTKVTKCEENIMNLKSELNSLNMRTTGAESEINSLKGWAMDFISNDWSDLALKVNNLEKRIEELENA